VLGFEPKDGALRKGGARPGGRKGGLVGRRTERPVASIDGDDIFAVLEEARLRGIPGAERRNPKPSEARARAVAAVLSGMFAWCKERRIIKTNPCADLDRTRAPAARERTLSADEIKWFWQACAGANEPFGAIFKLLLLTGARLNEVAGMTRNEIDADSMAWRLPGNRTKNGKPHILSLSALARTILAEAKSPLGNLVFSTTGRTPVSGWSRAKRWLDSFNSGAPPNWPRGTAPGCEARSRRMQDILSRVSKLEEQEDRSREQSRPQRALEIWRRCEFGRSLAGRAQDQRQGSPVRRLRRQALARGGRLRRQLD
jgi:hypothetical protein